MGLFPDLDIKGLAANLDTFKALQEDLIDSIRENTLMQEELVQELRGLRRDLATREN
jgi:dsDNA-specific endonuclease/ATPase MutS2